MKTILEHFLESEKLSLLSEYLLSKQKTKNLPTPPKTLNMEEIINWLNNCNIKLNNIKEFPKAGQITYEFGHNPNWIILQSYDNDKNPFTILVYPDKKYHFYYNTSGDSTKLDFDETIEMMIQMIEDPYNEPIKLS